MRTAFAVLLLVAAAAAGCLQGSPPETVARPRPPSQTVRPEPDPPPPVAAVVAPTPLPTPAPTAPAWRPVAGRVVILDAGHGGNDEGAKYFGIREKDVNLDLVLRTAKILGAMGVDVRFTRRSDIFVSLPERSAIANRNPNAAFVSVHCNASGRNPNAHGVESFILSREFSDEEQCRRALGRYKIAGKNREQSVRDIDRLIRTCRAEGQILAAALQRSLSSRLGDIDRGVKPGNLAILRETFFCPVALVEVGFISHFPTNRKMASTPWRDLAAQALAEAVAAYLRKGS